MHVVGVRYTLNRERLKIEYWWNE